MQMTEGVWMAARDACSASQVLQIAPASSVLAIGGSKPEEELEHVFK